MTRERLVLVGGGEHARVVAEAVRSRAGAFDLIGFVAPGEEEETVSRLALPRLGDDAWLCEHPELSAVLGVGGIGDAGPRRRVVERLSEDGRHWPAVVHSAAWVSPTASLARGAVVLAGAVVQTGARVGAFAVLNDGAIAEHDVTVGDFAQLAPGAVVGGGASIGEDAFVGLGARVRDHVSVGAGALVAMGAAVVYDVAPGARVAGIPAREMRTR